jgi:DNA helicase-2/ATP-dependent DNA helicase PcrA
MKKGLELLNDLNEIQKEAVLQTEGTVLVLAGAGSGKTRLLTYKIAYLIRALEVSPYAILAITFTNKAANEMKLRVEQLLGMKLAKEMWVTTFHSASAESWHLVSDPNCEVLPRE